MQRIQRTFSEVYEVLKFLDKDLIKKVPYSVIKYIENEREKDYTIVINPNLPLEEQKLSNETYNVIAILKLKYWCENDSEREKILAIINENELSYKNLILHKYNKDNLFKRKNGSMQIEKQKKENSMVEYKVSLFSKIINKIKCYIFRIRKIR